MNRQTIMAALTPFVLFGAAWLGFTLYNPGDKQSEVYDIQGETEQAVQDVRGAVAPQSAVSVRQNGDEPAARAQDAARSDGGQSSKSLGYVGWSLADTDAAPKACFNFKHPLSRGASTRMRDYVVVSPKASFSVNVEGHDLCVSGLDYDKDYVVTLRSGLPGERDRRLSRDIEAEISFGDKPNYVGFAGSGIILPRANAEGLAIETVNVDTVSVEISYVPSRMLVRREPQAGSVTLEGDWGWEGSDAASAIREKVWSGDVTIKSVKNKTVTTVIPVTELVGGLKSGAYIVNLVRKHELGEERPAKAWRWIISTDMALASYQGDGGLTVSVRSIENAKTKSGIELKLLSANNSVLASETTDGRGFANFNAALLNGKGPKAAKMVMAYDPDGDYAILDLRRPSLDLTAFNVQGRKVASSLDVYAFTERGIYRPGETLNLTAMIRNARANAVDDRPVKLTVRRPNGMALNTKRFDKDALASHAGTLTWAYAIPASAPRGTWTIDIEAEGLGVVQTASFSVEDFVPQKLKVTVKADDSPIISKDPRDVTIDAQFLYGAPGAGLWAEAEARLKVDPNPFKDYADYAFGPAGSPYQQQLVDMGAGTTDGAGVVSLPLELGSYNHNSYHPLTANIVAGVAEPGGRYVQEGYKIPVRMADDYVGLDPQFEGGRIRKGSAAAFNVVSLDALGQRTSKKLSWVLVEEDRDYHWYRERGRWRYRWDVRDVPMESGALQTQDDNTVSWSRHLDWGHYRLDIRDGDETLAGHKFSVGWSSRQSSDTPDQLQLVTEQDVVSNSETVKLAVNAPYGGLGELVIANEKVRMIKPLSLSEGRSDLSFKFDPEWGDSVYALMTLYTPRNASERPVPRRAVGVAYIKSDRSAQTLDVSIQAPDVMRPGQKESVELKVENAPNGEKLWMNVAVVDEGILQLTKYPSPDAAKFYFGKKALAVELRDDYGRILNPNMGAAARIRSGGDSLGGEGLSAVPTKTVSLFNGVVEVKNGKASIPVEISDFNGELRIMATAWSKSAVGSQSAHAKIRDKVPAIVGLPRFLAPGDQAIATVSLDNVEGKVGTYKVDFSSKDSVQASEDLSFKLDEGQRLDNRVTLTASALGVDDLQLSVKGPGGYRSDTSFPIQVRTPYMPVTRSTFKLVQPSESFALSGDMITGFEPTGTDVTVSFSRLAGLDPAPYVNSLSRYPYGCTEQTVSKAMPLLYTAELGGIPGQREAERRRGLQKAISKLSTRQSLDGAFGLWRENDRYATPWLGVYVTDFLHRAERKGFFVSEDTMKRANKALVDISRMPRYSSLNYQYPSRSQSRNQVSAEAAAYAHFVMAQNGTGNLSQMRYMFDNDRKDLKSPLAKAYLAGALRLMGDKRRSTAGFAEAVSALGYEDRADYYQTSVRDIAGVIATASDSGDDRLATSLVEALSEEVTEDEYLHTQEKAYLIRALSALVKTSKPPKVAAKGVALSDGVRPSASLLGTNVSDRVSFKNRDKSPIWATITVSGVPNKAPEPMEEGFNLSKNLYTMDGKPWNKKSVKQGERFIVSLSFNSTKNIDRTVVLADLLPAGFEIEAVLRAKDGERDYEESGTYSWLGEISNFAVTEARDDRFIASTSTDRRRELQAAYIVRAVTGGDFILPGAVVEDMYRPADRAITETGRVQIMSDSSN